MRKTLTKGGSQQALVPAPGAWLYWPHVSPTRLAASGQEDPGLAHPLPGGETPVTVDGVLPQPWAECQVDLPPFWHQLGNLLSLVAPVRSPAPRAAVCAAVPVGVRSAGAGGSGGDRCDADRSPPGAAPDSLHGAGRGEPEGRAGRLQAANEPGGGAGAARGVRPVWVSGPGDPD